MDEAKKCLEMVNTTIGMMLKHSDWLHHVLGAAAQRCCKAEIWEVKRGM